MVIYVKFVVVGAAATADVAVSFMRNFFGYFCYCFWQTNSFWTMFRFICFLSLAKRTHTHSRAHHSEKHQQWMKLHFGMMHIFFLLSILFYVAVVQNFCCAFLHSEHECCNGAAATAVKIKWCGKWHAIHSSSVHTEASTSRATTFKCNKNKFHVFSVSNTFRLISICSDRGCYYFFLRLLFHFVLSYFFVFLVIIAVLHVVLILLCYFLGSLHQSTALWLSLMNNAINCDFENNNKSSNRGGGGDGILGVSEKRKWSHCAQKAPARTRSFALKPKLFYCVLSHDFVAWPYILFDAIVPVHCSQWKSNTHKKSDATFDRVVTTFTFNVSKPQKNKCIHIHCYWYVYSLKCHTHAHHAVLTMEKPTSSGNFVQSERRNTQNFRSFFFFLQNSCFTLAANWNARISPNLTHEKSTYYAILLLFLGWQFLYCCFCHWHTHKLTKNPFTCKQTKNSQNFNCMQIFPCQFSGFHWKFSIKQKRKLKWWKI